jgi:nitrogen fixation/metabolism regulation signal transduction histidine kinase
VIGELKGKKSLRLKELYQSRQIQNFVTLSLVFIGPILAAFTVLTFGPLNQNINSTVLRLILLADLIYILLVAALILRRVMRVMAERRLEFAGSRLHLRLSGVFAFLALMPTILVAIFAVFTVNFGLEGWFSERVRNVVGSSLAAAQAYEDEHRKDLTEDALSFAYYINSIKTKNFLLSMGLQGEDRELTDLIVEEARRIVKLLEHVERFGDVRPPVRVPVNVHDALDRARKSALVGFAKHMHIIEEYDPSLPPTFADNDQLMQVFLNLIKNATEAVGAKGGTIRLHTYFDISWRFRRRDGSGNPLPLQIEIIDDGPGLPEHIANDVFEPFVSGRENGTGLGLALVSKIVHEHDGWITVESIPGRTVFRVALPLAPREGAAHPPSVALAAHSGLTIKDL